MAIVRVIVWNFQIMVGVLEVAKVRHHKAKARHHKPKTRHHKTKPPKKN